MSHSHHSALGADINHPRDAFLHQVAFNSRLSRHSHRTKPKMMMEIYGALLGTTPPPVPHELVRHFKMETHESPYWRSSRACFPSATCKHRPNTVPNNGPRTTALIHRFIIIIIIIAIIIIAIIIIAIIIIPLATSSPAKPSAVAVAWISPIHCLRALVFPPSPRGVVASRPCPSPCYQPQPSRTTHSTATANLPAATVLTPAAPTGIRRRILWKFHTQETTISTAEPLNATAAAS